MRRTGWHKRDGINIKPEHRLRVSGRAMHNGERKKKESRGKGTHLLHSLHLEPFGSRVDVLHQFLISLQPEDKCELGK